MHNDPRNIPPEEPDPVRRLRSLNRQRSQAMAVFCDFWTAMDVNRLAVAETSTLGIWVGDQSVSPTAADRSSRQIACPCPASRFRRSHSLSSGWRSGAFERTPRSQ